MDVDPRSNKLNVKKDITYHELTFSRGGGEADGVRLYRTASVARVFCNHNIQHGAQFRVDQST